MQQQQQTQQQQQQKGKFRTEYGTITDNCSGKRMHRYPNEHLMQLHRYFDVLDQNPDSTRPYYYHPIRISSSKAGQQVEDEQYESDESNLTLTDQLHNTNKHRNNSNNTIPNYLCTSVGMPLARCTWKIIVQDDVGGGSSGVVEQQQTQQTKLPTKGNRCCCCCCCCCGGGSTYDLCCHDRATTGSAPFL